ncbi:Zn-dependent hydrolase [Amycolatopsis acidiphila]|uniref:Zn-dependent hydrolase n=1 Tax=Amycolatopsis acidiphila TaxID=715473 RepID=A0A558ANN8_9PSEU|nr:Zn-dependent hydrolase [Amycolatopsis acidiphila]TVT25879.1 Zn-dependent hydrolase [Amycolatopsis acidiphila]UIJ63425.1 Zn-dependent hydrolase [Amycolatopsis acidiphila]GHG75541.1 Zn-dependent hydrolase [Amycolatopsis acidiphila]
MTDLVADPARLRERIDTFAGLSERDSGPGVTRLAYTPLERAAHELFAESMSTLGLKVWVDAAGNTIAERSGSDATLPAIGTGSHVDSVPNGGAFDGIVGVCAAMEAARLLVEHNVAHRHPMRFVVFAAEEGARFGQACTGSRIAAGLTGPGDLPTKQDADGVSLADAMTRVGLNPASVADAVWRPAEWAAFVELHIEQGSVLETDGVRLGVVDSISGSTRLLLELSGRATHSGGTPMHLRADAMAAAAEVVLAIESLAGDEHNVGTRTTVGKIDVTPGSMTTIAGHATLWVDVRGTDAQRQRDTAKEIVRRAEAICAGRGIGFQHEQLADTPPVRLPDGIRHELAASCRSIGVEPRVLTSGASHDAQQINNVTPSGMLFVPSKEGISHDPAEWTSIEDIAVGTTALTAGLLRLDEILI